MTDLFFLDTTGSAEAEDSVAYTADFVQPLTDQAESENEAEQKHVKVCFNCEQPGHEAPACTEPRNETVFRRNLAAFLRERSENGNDFRGRFYDEKEQDIELQQWRTTKFPGCYSSKLRRALSMSDTESAPFISQMRILHHPPAWNKDTIYEWQHPHDNHDDTLIMHDNVEDLLERQKEDERKQVEVYFPGFNCYSDHYLHHPNPMTNRMQAEQDRLDQDFRQRVLREQSRQKEQRTSAETTSGNGHRSNATSSTTGSRKLDSESADGSGSTRGTNALLPGQNSSGPQHNEAAANGTASPTGSFTSDDMDMASNDGRDNDDNDDGRDSNDNDDGRDSDGNDDTKVSTEQQTEVADMELAGDNDDGDQPASNDQNDISDAPQADGNTHASDLMKTADNSHHTLGTGASGYGHDQVQKNVRGSESSSNHLALERESGQTTVVVAATGSASNPIDVDNQDADLETEDDDEAEQPHSFNDDIIYLDSTPQGKGTKEEVDVELTKQKLTHYLNADNDATLFNAETADTAANQPTPGSNHDDIGNAAGYQSPQATSGYLHTIQLDSPSADELDNGLMDGDTNDNALMGSDMNDKGIIDGDTNGRPNREPANNTAADDEAPSQGQAVVQESQQQEPSTISQQAAASFNKASKQLDRSNNQPSENATTAHHDKAERLDGIAPAHTFDNWWIKFIKSKLVVCGEEQGAETAWRSSAIVQRVDAKTVLSKSGKYYRLAGEFQAGAAREVDVPEAIIQAFEESDGFPVEWEDIIKGPPTRTDGTLSTSNMPRKEYETIDAKPQRSLPKLPVPKEQKPKSRQAHTEENDDDVVPAAKRAKPLPTLKLSREAVETAEKGPVDGQSLEHESLQASATSARDEIIARLHKQPITESTAQMLGLVLDQCKQQTPQVTLNLCLAAVHRDDYQQLYDLFKSVSHPEQGSTFGQLSIAAAHRGSLNCLAWMLASRHLTPSHLVKLVEIALETRRPAMLYMLCTSGVARQIKHELKVMIESSGWSLASEVLSEIDNT